MRLTGSPTRMWLALAVAGAVVSCKAGHDEGDGGEDVTGDDVSADDVVVDDVDIEGTDTTPPVTDYPESLDEMFNRKARRLSATYPFDELEDASNHYLWQPETLMYHDVQTGHEAWRMTDTPNFRNYYHNDIGVSPWSADGKRMAYTSWERPTAAYEGEDEWPIWMIMDTSGRYLRPAVGSPGRVGGGYFPWSPQEPDTFHEIGDTHLYPYGEGPDPAVLYRVVVGDTDITFSPLVTYPFEGGNLGKYVSGDGRRVIARRYTSDTTPGFLYPTIIFPTSAAAIEVPDGYAEDREFGPYGNTPDPVMRYHDAYYAGDGSFYYAMPSGGSTWWRIATTGTATDGGALYTGDLEPPPDSPPYDFGEVWPENHGEVSAGYLESPFAQDNPYDPARSCYWSHFVPDRWGRHSLFSASCDGLALGYGPAVWDVRNHAWVVPSFGGGAQHHDWHGFTDWTVFSRGAEDDIYLEDRIYTQKYDDDASQETVVHTHTLYNQDGVYGGAESQYDAIPRPAQSPDGTKVAYHSTFLNPDDFHPDVYWAVTFYPFPPTVLSATYEGGVNVEWLPPMYTDRGWPYARPDPATDSFGWPLLDGDGREIGEPLYAREIKSYHVWRSPTGDSGWQEVGVVDARYAATYAEDATMLMLHPTSGGLAVDGSNRIGFTDSPGDGTFYYAVTVEEHSGIESRDLSEILEVTVSGGSITSATVVEPQGQSGFWTVPPAPPTGFTVEARPTPGHYLLSWTEPGEPKIRFYNIYYGTEADPPASQPYRIASIPTGFSAWLDWLADPVAEGHYGITSVDRQGNESAIVYP